MVTILHRELERKVEKVKRMHEVGGHAAEDQKQYEFPAWIKKNKTKQNKTKQNKNKNNMNFQSELTITDQCTLIFCEEWRGGGEGRA